MAKSLGNTYTIPQLIGSGHSPSAIRYLLLSAHYRTQLNFTLEGLAAADRSLDRLVDFRDRLKGAGGSEAVGSSGRAGALVVAWKAAFDQAMDDDLGVSGALAATFDLVRDGNAAMDVGELDEEGAAQILDALAEFDEVFGVLALRDGEDSAMDPDLTAWVEERIGVRRAAREARDFETADAVRRELDEKGIVLEDTASGTRWKKRSEAVLGTPDGDAE